MDILPRNQLKLFTQEMFHLETSDWLCSLLNLTIVNCGSRCWNAYLQALTKEMLDIVPGPEFEELQGHVLGIYKALYGTRSG